jgi:hypothetical protein
MVTLILQRDEFSNAHLGRIKGVFWLTRISHTNTIKVKHISSLLSKINRERAITAKIRQDFRLAIRGILP